MSAFRGRRPAGSARTAPAPAHAPYDDGCPTCVRLATGEPLTLEEALSLMTGGSGEWVKWEDEDDAT